AMEQNCSNVPAQDRTIKKGYSVTSSALLFSAGVLGNLIALVILFKHKLHSKQRLSVFYILVTWLVVTDFFGKCLISPVVFASYAVNRTLLCLPADGSLCEFFGVCMAFFGLVSMLILLAMALECWLSIGQPYFYQQHVTKRKGLLVPPAIHIFCLLFCCSPLWGFGKIRQYSPGTWCFIEMNQTNTGKGTQGYSVLYATLNAVSICIIIVCNVTVMKNLFRMYKRQNRRKSNRSTSLPNARVEAVQEAPAEEVDHLCLLALMTVVFIICSVPLTVMKSMNES
uniref:Thromboxane A2 receptor n=1 Tax=Latimeria chalumnae TaxID=7897 RepID=H2ZSE2_LATCH